MITRTVVGMMMVVVMMVMMASISLSVVVVVMCMRVIGRRRVGPVDFEFSLVEFVAIPLLQRLGGGLMVLKFNEAKF